MVHVPERRRGRSDDELRQQRRNDDSDGRNLSRRLNDEQRKAVGITPVLVGAATTIPAAFAVFGSEGQKALAA